MKVEVRLFAAARAMADRPSLEVELPAPATVGNLREILAEQCPALAPVLSHCVFAIGNAYAQDTTPIGPDDDVACIPPVSGG